MHTNVQVELCTKCKGAAVCTIPHTEGKPVRQCKTFESFEYFVPAILQGQVQKAGWEAASRVFGLCGDCGNHDTCMFRQREGGTWHCEEYC